MAQEEARRAIKYGDVFEMSGELADMPISPRDAAAMRSAENTAFGKTLKGGPASLMHSAASKNLQAGLVGADDDSGFVPADQTAAEPHFDLFVEPPLLTETLSDDTKCEADLTIGDALEVAALVMADKPVDRKDAAAISVAELRATRSNLDGVGDAARAAANANDRIMRDEDKITVAQVIGDVKGKLSDDKPVEKRDAEWVAEAELRQESEGVVTGDLHQTTPGGVADTVAMAAKLNET